jgi:uncharacterized membrane protein YkvA (DUF1232 family)
VAEQETAGEQDQPAEGRLRSWSRRLKRDVAALYWAMKHPETPWPAKIVAAVVVCYALSPIDLIPDFVPVLGYLDDLILVPLGIALVIKLLPREVLAFCRRQAEQNPAAVMPWAWVAASTIVALWLLAGYGLYRALGSHLSALWPV